METLIPVCIIQEFRVNQIKVWNNTFTLSQKKNSLIYHRVKNMSDWLKMKRMIDGCNLIHVCLWQFCVFRRVPQVNRAAESENTDPRWADSCQLRHLRAERRETLNNRGQAAPCQEQQSPGEAWKYYSEEKMNKWELKIKELTVSSAEQVTSRLSSKGEKAMSVTRSEERGGKTHS